MPVKQNWDVTAHFVCNLATLNYAVDATKEHTVRPNVKWPIGRHQVKDNVIKTGAATTAARRTSISKWWLFQAKDSDWWQRLSFLASIELSSKAFLVPIKQLLKRRQHRSSV